MNPGIGMTDSTRIIVCFAGSLWVMVSLLTLLAVPEQRHCLLIIAADHRHHLSETTYGDLADCRWPASAGFSPLALKACFHF